MKFRNYFKDILLVLLVFIMLFQFFQIWNSNVFISADTQEANGRLRDYIVEPILQFFGRGKADIFSQNINDLMRPQKIILNQSNQRAVLYDDNESYNRFFQISEDVIRRLFTGEVQIKSRELVSLDDYCAVLKGNSLYLDYGNFYDFRLYSVSVCGEARNVLSNDFSSVRECMIGLDDNVLNNVVFYMKDYRTENILRYTLEVNKTSIDNELKNYFLSKPSDTTLSYSFELNFHKQESGEGNVTRPVFDPLILFSLVTTECRSILPDQSWPQVWNEMEAGHTNEILNSFQINPRTTRKYTNLTNAKVFVENNGTLTISPEGYLEYRTVEGGQGLSLPGMRDNNMDIYSVVSSAVDFVHTLNENIPGDALSSLRFSSDLTESGAQSSYTITFDTFVAGLPVLQTNPESEENAHSITMQIENGYLKYYCQFLKQYRTDDETEPLTPVINAIDGLMDQLEYQTSYLNILDVSRCYVDRADANTPKPYWNITVDGIDSILTVK